MIHGLVPPYLSLLLPPLVGENSRYSLRNSDHYQNIKSKSQLYYNLFLPSAIREWNSLDASVKSSQSVTSLKKSLYKWKLVPSYYYHGNRKSQMLHTRIRTNCSSLNFYLYRKKHYTKQILHMWCSRGHTTFLFHLPAIRCHSKGHARYDIKIYCSNPGYFAFWRNNT